MLGALRRAVRLHSTCYDIVPRITRDESLQPSPVLILFSGGVDSALIAALTHEGLPDGEPIDLATICFDDGRSPDRQSALDALQVSFAVTRNAARRLIQCTRSIAFRL